MSYENLCLPEKPVGATGGTEKVLFSFSTIEQSLFLPDFVLADSPGEDASWFPSCEHSEAEWIDYVMTTRPAVLVTNWSSLPIPACVLEAPDCQLRYVCHMAGTVRHLVPRVFLENGGLISNWSGLAGTRVAEHALLLALAALRRLPTWRPYMKKERSKSDWPMLDIGAGSLFGKKIGIYGFGHVARSLVNLLKPFGCDLYSYSEGVPQSLFAEYEVTPTRSLAELFGKSHVVFVCEALNDRTQESIDAPELALLPDGAVFVNVGRGALVQETALAKEAESGRILVALDVLSNESDISKSPFWNLPDAILSPHIAGPTLDQLPLLGKFAMMNLERYLSGRLPEGLVTIDIYDRST